MKEKTTVYHNGLAVEVEIYSAPATSPTYSCGGTPPEWDMEILSATVDDEEEFSMYAETEDFSDANAEKFAYEWEDEIDEAIG